MRFSLKWILAVMVYIAIAATALGQPSWLRSDTLWVITILSNVYAATLAVFARGRRQVAAVGFVFATIGFAGCLRFADFFLIDDIFLVLGLDGNDPVTVLRLRATHALAALAFGVMGWLVGLMAYRAAGPAK
jgi:hypothetical protein